MDHAPTPPVAPPFEVLPGQVVRDSPVEWGYRAARPEPVAETARRAEPAPLDGTASLAPFTGEFDRRRVRHLLRRTGFSAPAPLVDAVGALAPGQAVDALVDRVLALGADPAPGWIDDAPPHWREPKAIRDAYWAQDWERYEGQRDALMLRAQGSAGLGPLDEAALGFRDRLTLFWHNHFVTHRDSYRLAPWLVRYWRLMQAHALGDVRALTHEMGRQPAMLVYLNGVDNRAGAPNENYARELLELFTMGITGPDGAPNYTQDDVTEIARALTGWGVDYYGETDAPLDSAFVPDWHDAGEKTIFGQTGAWGYDDVVRIVFEQRADAAAWWIASALYREFVYDVPHPGVVGQLADELRDGGWQVAPVVRRLLKSEHFFDAAALGVQVRSPFEHHAAAHREIGYAPDTEFLGGYRYTMKLAGQEVFRPPTVAGWPGGRAWLDTSRLTSRWLYGSWLIWQQETYREFAAAMPDPWDAERLAADVAQALLGVPLPPDQARALTPILLNGIPAYEWNPETDGAARRIRRLVEHLLRLPEFQLA